MSLRNSLRRFSISVRCGLEFLTAFCAVFFAAGPAHARDMMGVVDLSNRAVIPCSYKIIRYVGCGLYLCEGFESGPGTQLERLSFVPFRSLSQKVKEAAERHGSGKQKVLLDRYGNSVKPNLPKKSALLDVYIPDATQRAYLLDAKKKSEVTGLPKDALLAVAGVDGMGVCDVEGKYVIEPIFPALIVGSAASGKVSGFKWDELKEKLIQIQIPLIISSESSVSKTSSGQLKELPDAMKKAYEGMSLYRSPEGLFGYVDEQGAIAIPAKYYSASHFSGGVAAVRLNPRQGPEKGRECYIDKKGNIVSPIYWRAGAFYGDYALVAEKGEEPVGKGRYRRDLYGLIDRDYKFFLPLAPTTIRYLPEGFWVIGTGIEPAIVLNRQGKEVFRTPERASLFNDCGDAHIFVTSGAGEHKLLYYDKDWKLLKEVDGEPAQYGPVPTIVTKGAYGYDRYSAVVDGKGNFLIEYENAEFKSAESDRIIKTVFGTTFVKEDWDIPNRNRVREFQLFLKQYKLVGMKRSEVESLLGPGQKGTQGPNSFYTIAGFGAWCGNAYETVEIEYAGDRVLRWRYHNFGSDNLWNN